MRYTYHKMSRQGATLLTGIILAGIVGLATADHLFQGAILFQSNLSEDQEDVATHMQQLLTQKNIAFRETQEAHILHQLVQQENIYTFTLLEDRDRIGSFSFIQTDHALDLFLKIKQTLSLSFSPDVHNLKDEEKTTKAGETLFLLQFQDPALNAEHMVLGTSGDLLFEFHSADEHQKAMQELIKTLLGIPD